MAVADDPQGPPLDHAERARAWEAALGRDALPDFVTDRLGQARSGRSAWVATMTPAELLIARSHGVRPIATVTGTCWYGYGWSWTEGHAEGWHMALNRIRSEAVAAGANAVVDVRLRTIRHQFGASMDFTLIGTAVRVERLTAGPDPVIATVPALEFVRLLEADIVPVGIAVGARYAWLDGWSGAGAGNSWGAFSGGAVRRTQYALGQAWASQPLPDLTDFWEGVRREAHADLRRNAALQGNGVLAHTHFGQLLRRERDKQPAAYLGRHIVVGTVVDTRPLAEVPHGIEMVVDMRDGVSPLKPGGATRHSVYESDVQDEEGSI